jgi:hypothetical protein
MAQDIYVVAEDTDLTNHLLKEACQLFQKLSRSWQLFIHLGMFSGASTPPTCNKVFSFKTYQEYHETDAKIGTKLCSYQCYLLDKQLHNTLRQSVYRIQNLNIELPVTKIGSSAK